LTKIIAIIPARAGSKRLEHKNRLMFNHKPLYAHTVEQAMQCDFIDEIIVSTDDVEIIDDCECEYMIKDPRITLLDRPAHLCGDDTLMWAVVEHACWEYTDDTMIILLQPTSPLRTVYDIKSAYRLFQLHQERIGVVSVYWEYPQHEMVINGAIYIHKLGFIRNCKSFIANGMVIYIMPKERSVDIDTWEDFREAERLMQWRENQDG